MMNVVLAKSLSVGVFEDDALRVIILPADAKSVAHWPAEIRAVLTYATQPTHFTDGAGVLSVDLDAYEVVANLVDDPSMLIPQHILAFIRSRCNTPPLEPAELARLQAMPSFIRLNMKQQRCVEFTARFSRTLNSSDMGTGKTCMSLVWALYHARARILVVCPPTVAKQWCAEVAKFTGLTATVIDRKHPLDKARPAEVMVISSDSLRLLNRAQTDTFDTVIVDEAHRFKNPLSMRSRKVLALCRTLSNVLLLTGTPGDKPAHIFPLLQIIDPSTFRQFHVVGTDARVALGFSNRYCAPEKKWVGRAGMVWQHTGDTLPWEVHTLLAVSSGRVRKSTDMLPAKTRKMEILRELTQAEQLEHKADMQELDRIAKSRGQNAGNAYLMELVRNNTRRKMPYVCDYIQRQLANDPPGNKYLLFAHHRFLMDGMREILTSNGIDFIEITGETPLEARHAAVQRFETTPTCRYALLSIRAAGVGLTLVSANVVIFAETTWSETDMLQAEDRAHRIGQNRPVTVIYLTLKHSIDETVLYTIVRKAKSAAAKIDNELGGLSFRSQRTAELQ